MPSFFCIVYALVGCVATARAAVEFIAKSNFSSLVLGQGAHAVLFYAPWCKHSKEFLPIYEESSTAVDLPLYKVDCIVEKDLYWQEKIESFPTIKFYINGKSFDYAEDRDLETFVSFSKMVASPVLVDLDKKKALDLKGIQKLAARNTPALVFYSPTSNGATGNYIVSDVEFVCKKWNYIRCYVTQSAATAALMGSISNQPQLTMVRRFKGEEGFTHASAADLASTEKLYSWVQGHSYPYVVEFIQSNERFMFSTKRPGFAIHIALVLNRSNKDSETAIDGFRSIAMKNVGKAVFIEMNNDPNVSNTFLESTLEDLRIEASDGSTAIIIQSMKTKVQFFRLPKGTDTSYEALDFWVHSFFSGGLVPDRVEVVESA